MGHLLLVVQQEPDAEHLPMLLPVTAVPEVQGQRQLRENNMVKIDSYQCRVVHDSPDMRQEAAERRAHVSQSGAVRKKHFRKLVCIGCGWQTGRVRRLAVPCAGWHKAADALPRRC